MNSAFAIFSKTGTVLYGPADTNTLWSGFGGGCQTNNDGDATVKYDQAADRWIISQFSVSTSPYLQCVAVSTSGDPTGTYTRYAFQYNDFPDYPKLGIWPDAFYETFNLFNSAGTAFLGPEVCAYDRAAMLAGQTATQQCFVLDAAYGGLLPSDVDGATPPPAGSPNFILGLDTNSLDLWKFHVDWANSASTTLAGPTSIPVDAFQLACGGSGGVCVPQDGTTTELDTLGDRLMYRLAYRNFGDHESLVVTHAVTAGTSTGVRWYEIRDPNGSPTVYQQSTFAPDSDHRWMSSAAMDHLGDLAVGYNVSSSTTNPSIRYAGRLASDPLNTLSQGETTLIAGTGSQTTYTAFPPPHTAPLTRWGDYSSMSIDPTDDCTFWYTTEYLTTDGSFNWHTRVGAFAFPDCVPVASMSVSSLDFGSVAVGTTSASQDVTITNTGGSPLVINDIALTGANPGDFGFTSATPPITLQPAENIVVPVMFTPSLSGARSATLEVSHNGNSSPSTVLLSGGGHQRNAVADFNGDGVTDVAIFRPSTGRWAVKGLPGVSTNWGQDQDIPVPGDYNGDGVTDVAIFRPSTGRWAVKGVAGVSTNWGQDQDIPVPGDYNGDGVTDVAIFRPSTGRWAVKGLPGVSTNWGQDGDIPVPGGYNGDGVTDIAIFRPSTGRWAVKGLPGVSTNWGQDQDIPVPGDYNGDGVTDIAIFRPSTGRWAVKGVAGVSTNWGQDGDIPVPGDYNGDGVTDIAIFRPSKGRWAIKGLPDVSTNWGTAADIPVSKNPGQG